MNRRDLFKTLAAVMPAGAVIRSELLPTARDLLIVEATDDYLTSQDVSNIRTSVGQAFGTDESRWPKILVTDKGVKIRVERGVARIEQHTGDPDHV